MCVVVVVVVVCVWCGMPYYIDLSGAIVLCVCVLCVCVVVCVSGFEVSGSPVVRSLVKIITD